MKFLLDENVHRGLLSFLTGIGHDVMLSPEGITNGRVFELASREERILISRDSDFTSMAVFKHSGMLLLRIDPKDLEAQKRALSGLFARCSKPEEFVGKFIRIVAEDEFEFL